MVRDRFSRTRLRLDYWTLTAVKSKGLKVVIELHSLTLLSLKPLDDITHLHYPFPAVAPSLTNLALLTRRTRFAIPGISSLRYSLRSLKLILIYDVSSFDFRIDSLWAGGTVTRWHLNRKAS